VAGQADEEIERELTSWLKTQGLVRVARAR
jgi:hypothetical protein